MKRTIDITCKVCGEPKRVDADLTGDELVDGILLRVSERVVHDSCMTRLEQGWFAEDSAKLLDARVRSWAGICWPRFQDTEFSKIPYARKNDAMKWEYGPKGLLLSGQTRGGKTRLMLHLLKREHMAGKSIAVYRHSDLCREARQVVFGDPDVAARWSIHLSKVHILFIDDLGKTSMVRTDGVGKQAEEFTYDVLESRWNNNLPCMFTMNDSAASLVASMSEERGKPFIARLKEFCVVL